MKTRSVMQESGVTIPGAMTVCSGSLRGVSHVPPSAWPPHVPTLPAPPPAVSWGGDGTRHALWCFLEGCNVALPLMLRPQILACYLHFLSHEMVCRQTTTDPPLGHKHPLPGFQHLSPPSLACVLPSPNWAMFYHMLLWQTLPMTFLQDSHFLCMVFANQVKFSPGFGCLGFCLFQVDL